MIIKGILDEDFINYKKPSMTIEYPYCTMKCGADICQNHPLLKEPDIDIAAEVVANRYINNLITEAIVMQGLEPLDSFDDVYELISCVRNKYDCHDDIVIYTGYEEDEIKEMVARLQEFDNIIIKFGRYVCNDISRFDDVLGVELASKNQYAKRVS